VRVSPKFEPSTFSMESRVSLPAPPVARFVVRFTETAAAAPE